MRVPLHRLFKKKSFAPLLAQAETLLGPGWRVQVTETSTDGPASGQGRCFPIHLDDAVVGYLSLVPTKAAARSEGAGATPETVGPFLVGCLEQLLAGEALRRTLASETLLKYREIALLHRATFSLNGSLRPREVALALLTECQRDALPAEVGMVFLSDSEAGTSQPVVAFGPVAACGLAGLAKSAVFRDIARSRKGEIINDLEKDQRWHDEAALQSLLLSPLVAAGRTVGMLALGCVSPLRFEASHLQHVGTLASVAGIAIDNALHFEAVQTLIHSLMQALAAAIDARDPCTAGHSRRVARLGVALAKVVHDDRERFPDVTFTPSDLEELLYAGLLHDVGKIGIREEVLTKASRLPASHLDVIGQRLALRALLTGESSENDLATLTRINVADVVGREDASRVAALGAQALHIGDRNLSLLSQAEMSCLLIPRGNLTADERREIERHPAESFRILQHIPFPENMGRLLTIISQHHERLDGSGYPAGLEARAILLQSRIIAIVDIYDAITTARHYKPALPREKAMDILWQEAEAGRIDRQLVELFGRHLDAIERDCETWPSRLDFAAYLAATPAPAPDAD